jgi:hypothetical protein
MGQVVESDVSDIVIAKAYGVETSTPLTKSSKNEVLAELVEVSKVLSETIKSSTIREMNVDNLIKLMTKEQEDKDEEEGRADQSDEVNSSD